MSKITKYRIAFYSCILISVGLSALVIGLSENSNDSGMDAFSTVLLIIMALFFAVGTICFIKITRIEKKEKTNSN